MRVCVCVCVVIFALIFSTLLWTQSILNQSFLYSDRACMKDKLCVRLLSSMNGEFCF